MQPGSKCQVWLQAPGEGPVSLFTATSPSSSSLAVAPPCPCRNTLQSCPGPLSLHPKGAPLQPCIPHYNLTLRDTPSFTWEEERRVHSVGPASALTLSSPGSSRGSRREGGEENYPRGEVRRPSRPS